MRCSCNSQAERKAQEEALRKQLEEEERRAKEELEKKLQVGFPLHTCRGRRRMHSYIKSSSYR